MKGNLRMYSMQTLEVMARLGDTEAQEEVTRRSMQAVSQLNQMSKLVGAARQEVIKEVQH